MAKQSWDSHTTNQPCVLSVVFSSSVCFVDDVFESSLGAMGVVSTGTWLAMWLHVLLLLAVPAFSSASHNAVDTQRQQHGRVAVQTRRRRALANGGNNLPFQPYLILMETGSTGSSWLTHLLDSHPNIISKGEGTFNVGSFRQILTSTKGRDSDVKAVGIKVKRDRMRGMDPRGVFFNYSRLETHQPWSDRIPPLLDMLNRIGAKLVCLYRRNFVKHAVSQVGGVA